MLLKPNRSASTLGLRDFPRLNAFQRWYATAVLLNCPHCCCGKLYQGMYELFPRCRVCGTKFEPDGGEWTGAVWLATSFGFAAGLALWTFLWATGRDFDGMPFLIMTITGLGLLSVYRYIKAGWIWFMYVIGFVRVEPIRDARAESHEPPA